MVWTQSEEAFRQELAKSLNKTCLILEAGPYRIICSLDEYWHMASDLETYKPKA